MTEKKMLVSEKRRFEEYFSGKMSAEEMHQLETDALEDPILQEMMDGYAFVNQEKFKRNLKEIENKIGKKEAIVIHMRVFLRIAALITIIGAGVIIFTLVKRNQDRLNAAAIAARQQKSDAAKSNNDSLEALSLADLKKMHQFKGILLDEQLRPLKKMKITGINGDSLTISNQKGEFLSYIKDTTKVIKITGSLNHTFLIKAGKFNRIIVKK
jgi:hypothetical protein